MLYKKIKTYCVSGKKNTANKISGIKLKKTKKTQQNRLMLLSNCVVCGKEKLRFNKNQEASRLKFY